MPKNIPLPNDSEDNVNRSKKTISQMEAEAAMDIAEGTERASIKSTNERRNESNEELEEEIHSYQQYRRSQSGWL